MATQQILVLLFQVRILVGQREEESLSGGSSSRLGHRGNGVIAFRTGDSLVMIGLKGVICGIKVRKNRNFGVVKALSDGLFGLFFGKSLFFTTLAPSFIHIYI